MSVKVYDKATDKEPIAVALDNFEEGESGYLCLVHHTYSKKPCKVCLPMLNK